MQQLDQYDEGFVEEGFDAVAADYGDVLFLRRAAQALVDAVGQHAVTRVLDVCTGPGTAALLLANGQSVEVVGIDVAAGMVATASHRARQLDLTNVRFEVASALGLPFEAASFDAVMCSSAIYYMADFERAIREWLRVLRPEGRLAFSTFGAGALEPMSVLFDARVRGHGIVVPQPTPLYRLNRAAACRELLEAMGLRDVVIHEQQLGYWVPDEAAWWQMLMSTGFQALVAALPQDDRAAFERAHKDEVRAHVEARGLWIDAPVIVASGRKPTIAS